METRAHHLLIGIFVLLVIAGVFAFTIWLARGDINRATTDYDIIFEGSVAGLSNGAVVQFNGVPVGQVRDIQIVPDTPRQVRVVARIQDSTPINVDTVATLEAQGFTGVAYIQLRGGSSEAAPLERDRGDRRPVIEAERSELQELFERAPELLEASLAVLSNLEALIDPAFKDQIQGILSNVERVTAALAQEDRSIAATLMQANLVLEEATRTLQELRLLAGDARQLIQTTDALADEEIRTVLVQLDKTLQESAVLFANMNAVVVDNEDAVRTFINNTLPEATRLMGDLRRLTIAGRRIAEKFEQDPTSAIFGTPKPKGGDE